MEYIILDLEWNQPWPGSPSAKKVLPSPIRGEIVQIGAVRLREGGDLSDEFQTLIRPAYYKKMNRKVAKLTGIKDTLLQEQGRPFREAMDAFRSWCGENAAFLTWGFDDITILKENLTLYGMDTAWTDRWYNAQLRRAEGALDRHADDGHRAHAPCARRAWRRVSHGDHLQQARSSRRHRRL